MNALPCSGYVFKTTNTSHWKCQLYHGSQSYSDIKMITEIQSPRISSHEMVSAPGEFRLDNGRNFCIKWLFKHWNKLPSKWLNHPEILKNMGRGGA